VRVIDETTNRTTDLVSNARGLKVDPGTGTGQGTSAESTSVVLANDQRLPTDAGVYVAGDNPVAFDADIPNAPARGAIVLADGNVEFETVKFDLVTRKVIIMVGLKANDPIPFAIYRINSAGTTLTLAQIALGW